MRIKQIELNGFKSFMARTVLELPPGVTAIVGPNGCGKSNVVDAIRWVLGEQSPKHLRGALMEDVIFNGNAEQGPLGMAEVSLLLERDERDLAAATADDVPESGEGLPPELAHASEVLVTRRYFRSGESEYFINRAPCRLKDITELFLGTGVGAKAYAIVEQGRVDQLVSAKPEELRLFLEEAAGTTRFRSRKLAAERKMERTRENLVRVQDVLHELERQMTSLERQARRAEEYHRLKNELRDIDLRVMAGRQRAGSAEVDRLEKRIAALHDEELALHEDVRVARGATSDARSARALNEERLRAVDVELAERRVASREAQARIAGACARERELTERAAAGGRELEHLRARLTEVRDEGAQLAAEVERLGAEEPIAAAAMREGDARCQTLAAAAAPLEQAAEEAKSAVLDALGEEARLRNLAQALQHRREELAGRRRKLEDEQRVLGARLRENEKGSASAKAAAASLEAERARLATERRALAEAEQTLASEESERVVMLDRTRAQHTQLTSRADSLRALQARYEGCSRGVATLLTRGGEKGELLANLFRVPAELERAVAAALGARLTQLVVPDTASAVRAIGWLSKTAGGNATVVPRDAERRAATIVPPGRRLVDRIEVDPAHWALAEALLGQVLVADDLESALALWRAADHPVTVVTPKGEAVDALGAVSGGSEPALEETLLARQRELRELEQAIAASASQVVEAEQVLARGRERAAEVAATVAGVEHRLQAIRVELVSIEKDRERLEEGRGRISAELEVCALEVSGVTGEDGEVTSELTELDERMASAAREVSTRRAGLVERQTALARRREEYAEAERLRTDAAVRAAAAGERLRAARAECARFEERIRELDERLVATATRVADESRGAASARDEASQAEANRAAAEKRATELGAEHEGLLVALHAADTVLSDDDVKERTAQERLDAAREERGRLDVTLAEQRMALEHLAAQLAERYGLPLGALTEVAVDEEGGADRAERAEALRERLTRLGDVNPAAVEELEELRGRREFLVGQRNDLESSLEDLRRTITKLTRTSRERFQTTFEAANEKLAEVFPKLFAGGKARLELTTPEESGEPGVEIVVQPGGKKLQSLTLLSGGEKALTAVSLILSLFLIRPTPFCLLDEVDAPLDEANIGRFNQVVREMATSSQFVLITHNRRTMEAADTLYGITMEQAGVSKVVSVRLREAA
ncbi:MAG: chromosome segregation protein SMC [Deltaproteobacteria bacterium]|nr:MAG: chromosome segregation protein SMC [Deltaproteobacteria bacterium]